MKVSEMVLAEHASVDGQGCYTLRGAGFEQIEADTLPWVERSMYLFLRLRTTGHDRGINRLEVRLVRNGSTCFRAEGSMSVTSDGSLDPHVSMPLHFRNIVFGNEGDYSFQVFINGNLDAETSLRVRHNPSGALPKGRP
jgi:hypothetical protein